MTAWKALGLTTTLNVTAHRVMVFNPDVARLSGSSASLANRATPRRSGGHAKTISSHTSDADILTGTWTLLLRCKAIHANGCVAEC